MSMINKNSKIVKAIYIRIFSVLMAIYLVLMICFCIFLINQEKKAEILQLNSYTAYTNQTISKILRENMDDQYRIKDISKVKKQLVNNVTINPYLGSEMALFSRDFSLITQSNDYWVCNYTEYKVGNKSYSGYAYLNQHEWFNAKEIKEIEEYLYAQPKAKKAGELSGYTVDLDGFWLDNEMIIPHKVIVTPLYASSFDEHQNVNSSSGSRTGEIAYINNYKDQKQLPYFEYGNIIPVNTFNKNSETQSELRKLVQDEQKLEQVIQLGEFGVEFQREGLFTYKYYQVLPYENHFKQDNKDKNFSQFWTVFAGKINFYNTCKSTLYFVWISCLILFMAAAVILSAQTYRTYKKREEFDKQRSDTTNALAHDLKTPLCIISGYAQNLIENIHTDKREYYADNILTNVNRMDATIHKILELLKLESDFPEMSIEEVSLDGLCQDIVNRYKDLTEDRRITAIVEGNSVCKADKELIERVIDNFFINALNNTPEGGSISLRVNDNTFEIFNSGSYIPEDVINEIWLPYRKGDESRGNSKGTGLGLSIARKILNLHKFPHGAKNMQEGVLFWFKFL